MGAIFGGLIGLAQSWITNRGERQKAEAQELAKSSERRAQYSDRFSRRWILILVSAPIAISMVAPDYAKAMFEGLALVPPEWWALFSTIVSVTYGAPKVVGIVQQLATALRRPPKEGK